MRTVESTCSCSSVSRSGSWQQLEKGEEQVLSLSFEVNPLRVWRGWNSGVLIVFHIPVSAFCLNPSVCMSRQESSIQDLFKDRKQNTCCFPRGHGEEKDVEEAGVCVGGSLWRRPWENLPGSVGRLMTRDLSWPWLAQSKQLKIHDYLGNQITGKAVTWQFLQPPLFSLHVMFSQLQHIHQHSPLNNKLLGSQDSAWREMRGKREKQRPQTWEQRNRVFQTQVRGQRWTPLTGDKKERGSEWSEAKRG